MSARLHLTSCTTADIAEAHAHRVVAAPELVAELVAALRAVREWDDYKIYLPDAVAVQVRAAIARAEGAAP